MMPSLFGCLWQGALASEVRFGFRESILTIGMHLSLGLMPLLGELQGKHERVGRMKAICRRCMNNGSSPLLCSHGSEKGEGGAYKERLEVEG